MRTRLVPTLAVFGLVLAACGGSSDDAADGATVTPALPVTVAAVATDAPIVAPVTDPAATVPEATVAVPAETATPSGPATGNAVSVQLAEWSIVTAGAVPAGAVDFTVTNSGDFPHELVIFSGTSYADLPQKASGAIDDAAAGAALVGETERLDPGTTATLSVELAAGHYVFICNIEGGGGSHAGRGQILEVDVA